MPKFEILIYNEEVRAAVRNDEKHELNDDWADQHYIVMKADDMEGARRRALAKYPPEQGFVIVDILPADAEQPN